MFPLVILFLLAAFCAADGSGHEDAPTAYSEHEDLSFYLSSDGSRHAVETTAQWQRRREHILENVQLVMGLLPQPQTQIPLDPIIISQTALAGVVRQKVSYHTDSAEQRVKAWLFLPQPENVRRPAILCLHQTTKIGKDEPAGLGNNPNLDYAWELAQLGFVTLAPDYPSFGEYPYSFDDEYASGSMKAIYDNMRAIDFLQSLDEADPQRIGCIGHSLGGHNSIFTAVFDPRIQVVVSSCGFTSFHKYYEGDLTGWTSKRYMPRIATDYGGDPEKVPFDFAELIGALAPRPFFAVAPLDDHNFAVEGVRNVMTAAAPIYRLFDCAESLVADHPDCGHDFPPESRHRAYDFLEQHLRHAPQQ